MPARFYDLANTWTEPTDLEFLWDAPETNHTHDKYQFAFLACHILALVAANREPIAPVEQKIQATLARVWGGDTG